MSAKMGRPLKGETPRNERLNLRLSLEEKEMIIATAEANEMAVVDLVVEAVKGYVIPESE